jgi:hypothetical protein
MKPTMSHATRIVLVLLLMVISRATAQTATLLPDANDGPSFGVAAGEVGGALVAGGVMGLGLGYAAVRATGGASDLFDGPILPILAGFGGAVVGDAAGSALGTWLVGSFAQQDHSASGAVLGALVGLPVGLVLAAVAAAMENNGKPGALLLIPAFAAPAAGAVIGYNLTPPCGCTGSRPTFGRRLLPPSIGLARERGEAIVYAYDVRLLNIRF